MDLTHQLCARPRFRGGGEQPGEPPIRHKMTIAQLGVSMITWMLRLGVKERVGRPQREGWPARWGAPGGCAAPGGRGGRDGTTPEARPQRRAQGRDSAT